MTVLFCLFLVHFEEKEGHTVAHVVDDEKGEEEEILGGKTTEESMNEIVDAQKRILDQWCFAEHYEPKVLLQVNIMSSFTLQTLHNTTVGLQAESVLV